MDPNLPLRNTESCAGGHIRTRDIVMVPYAPVVCPGVRVPVPGTTSRVTRVNRLLTLLILLLLAFQASPGYANPALVPVRHVTIEQEIKLGNEVANEVRRKYGGDWDNPSELAHVRSIAWRVFNQSDRHDNPLLRANFSVELLNSPVVNAVCVPGGHTFVTRGLIQMGLSDDELAAVLGHEIAHAARRHGARNLEASQGLEERLDAWTHHATLRKAGELLILVYMFKHFDPQLEYEADYYGMIYATRAGFDPYGMVHLFERLIQLEHPNNTIGSRVKSMFMSLFDNHPPTAERLQRARNEAARLAHGETLPTTPVPIYE